MSYKIKTETEIRSVEPDEITLEIIADRIEKLFLLAEINNIDMAAILHVVTEKICQRKLEEQLFQSHE